MAPGERGWSLEAFEYDELADLVSGFLEALEVVEVEALLLERADEALRDTVALRLPHIGRGRPDPEQNLNLLWFHDSALEDSEKSPGAR